MFTPTIASVTTVFSTVAATTLQAATTSNTFTPTIAITVTTFTIVAATIAFATTAFSLFTATIAIAATAFTTVTPTMVSAIAAITPCNVFYYLFSVMSDAFASTTFALILSFIYQYAL